MAPLSYSSPWNFNEHRRAVQDLSRITFRRQPVRRLLPLGIIVIASSLFLGPRLLQTDVEINTDLIMDLLFLVLVLVLLIVMGLWGASHLAARRTQRLDPSAKGTLTRTLTDIGFRIDGAGQSVDLKWDSVHSAVETNEFLHIFHNKLCSYYVPKRLIATRDQLDEVRDLLRTKLGDRARIQDSRASRAA
jgi:YcxB-like protein